MQEPAEERAAVRCVACGSAAPEEARFCSACGQPLSSPAARDLSGDNADPLVGRLLTDRYRILSLIGRGGMGVVYKVEHVHIGKLMAMKLLHGELAHDRDVVKRFRREAEAASRLTHVNTVQIFDFGRSQGLMYLVMEYLPGRDLGSLLKTEGALDFARVARIGVQVCASVGEAHELGIVHRDLKPENIMVTDLRGERDSVKVLDFGLAKLREQSGANTITRAGALIGTPYYMSPEQIRGEPTDHRSDIYALGAVLYKALTGRPPFVAPTPMGILTKHLTESVEPPSSQGGALPVPAEADAVVLKALAKDPAERYQTMDELRQALIAYLTHSGTDLTPPTFALSATTPVSTPSLPGVSAARRRPAPVATRGDVDNYERRLRRRSRLSYVLWFLVIAAAGAGGSWLYTHRPARAPETREREPNGDPSTANPLPPGLRVEGFIGRRTDRATGDADVYALENGAGERRAVRVEVTSVPNIDLAVDLVRVGTEVPVLRVDSAGTGAPEVVPNFPLRGARYFLRILEAASRGPVPTENVSDPYTVRWDLVTEEPDDEREINDSLELAESLPVGASRRGYVGWRGDVDLYCLAPAPDAIGPVRVEVSGVAELDLVLRIVERDQGRSRKLDERGAGEGEGADLAPVSASSRVCVEVSADAADGRGAHAHAKYVLRAISLDPAVGATP